MTKSINLSGQVFNQLSVLNREGSDKWGMALWRCCCLHENCINTVLVRTSDLKSSNTKSCGKHFTGIDLTGHQFGSLVVLEYAGFIKKKSIWKCLCKACGEEKNIRGDDLPQRISCGCLANSEQVKENRRNTNLQRFGTIAPAQNETIKEKMKQTTIKRYGVENIMQSDIGKDRAKHSNLERYGVKWGVQNEQIKNRIRETNLTKYGVENLKQKHMTDVIQILRDKNKLSTLLSQNDTRSVAKFLNVNHTTISDYALSHGINDGYPSNLERSVSEWLSTLLVSFRKDRKILDGLEVDCLFETKSIGIEIDGLFYHCELSQGKNRNYHIAKHDGCHRKGIRLITLFEDEWYDRQSAVKTVIRTQLGLQERGPGARLLQIRQINTETAKHFFEEYHIQGSTVFSICYGAFNNNSIVAVMGFGHPTRQSTYQYELKRYCTDGKVYPGIASKFFKTFIKEHNPKSVVSFCDKRFFEGKSYEKMGFQYDREIPPDYTYTNDYRTRHHKSKFRLNRLRKMFDKPTDGKTEWELMQELGYDRIWDCGKIRYVWNDK